MLRSLPKSNKHSFVVVSFVDGVHASWGICCGSSFPFLPQIPRVSISGISHWRLTLARPRPDDSCLLRLVWLASFVATGELPSFRFFFWFNFSYIPLPCPAVSSPTSLSQSLVLCHSLSVFAFFFPCVRSPVVWFGSSFLSSPRAFSLAQRKKIFFHSFFLFLRFAIVVLLFFHSTVLMAQQKQLVLPDTFSGRSHDDFDI